MPPQNVCMYSIRWYVHEIPQSYAFNEYRTPPLYSSSRRPLSCRITVCAAQGAGDLFVFGDGDCGQLGLGEDVTEKTRPAALTIDDAKVLTSTA